MGALVISQTHQINMGVLVISQHNKLPWVSLSYLSNTTNYDGCLSYLQTHQITMGVLVISFKHIR